VDTHTKVKQTVTVHPLELSFVALLDCIQKEIKANPDDYKILAFLPTVGLHKLNAVTHSLKALDFNP
jgi:hypothetical protein